MDYIIGVDIGTGSTKAIAVDLKGSAIASSQEHYPTNSPSHGRYEQDPELIWIAFTRAVSAVVAKMQRNPSAISLSSAMHSVIPVDKHGKALAPMIIWADNRSGDIATKIKRSASGELIYEETGTPIHAMAPLSKLVWLREHEPSIFQNSFKFISIKEFIWYQMFRQFEVDYSIASATGLMNIQEKSWSRNAIEVVGVDESKLSTLRPTDFLRRDISSTAASAMSVSSDTTVVIGASDGCLANLGSFAITPGIAALTIGTSSAIRVSSPTPIYNFAAMTFNYILDDDNFICGGPGNNGGVALKWFAETFLQKPLNTIADYENVLKCLDDTKPGADGLMFLPYVFGERAPIWNSDASGVFFGVKGFHDQSHFTRAVIEGITMALLDIGQNIVSAGSEISQINVSGGFVRSTAWLHILADMFGKDICLINADDASAVGAAHLAMRKLRLINTYADLKHHPIKTIQPDAGNTAIYRGQFAKYRDLYLRVKDLMN